MICKDLKILTFDLEDWFHLLDHPSTSSPIHWKSFESRFEANTDRILQLLDANSQKASFFCLGWIARKYPYTLRKISDNGHDIGSHSDLHQLVFNQTLIEFEKDLVYGKKAIEDIIGREITLYRAPGFSIKQGTEWAFEILLKNGIQIDSSIFPTFRGHGGYSNFPVKSPCILQTKGMVLKEFPINTFNLGLFDLVFSGGGYFRAIPYPILNILFKYSNYILTYFHPRDFDPKQPMFDDLGLWRKFKSYYGLPNSHSKLTEIIREFEFCTISHADKNINWSDAEVVVL